MVGASYCGGVCGKKWGFDIVFRWWSNFQLVYLQIIIISRCEGYFEPRCVCIPQYYSTLQFRCVHCSISNNLWELKLDKPVPIAYCMWFIRNGNMCQCLQPRYSIRLRPMSEPAIKSSTSEWLERLTGFRLCNNITNDYCLSTELTLLRFFC